MDTCPQLNKTLDGDDVCDSTLLAKSFESMCTFNNDFSKTKSTKSNKLEKNLDLNEENESELGPNLFKLKTERSEDLFSHIITDIDPLDLGSVFKNTFDVGDVIFAVNGTMVTAFRHFEIIEHFNKIIQEYIYNMKIKLVIIIKRMTKFIQYTIEGEFETDLCEDGIHDNVVKLFENLKVTRKEPLEYTHSSCDHERIGTNLDDFIRYGPTCRKLTMDKIDTEKNPNFVFIKHQFYIVSDDVFICALQSETTGDYIYCKDNCNNIGCKQMGRIETIENCLIVPDKRFFIISNQDDAYYLESFIHRGYYITYNKVDKFKLKKAKEPWSVEYAVKHNASDFQFKMIRTNL